MKIKEKIWKYQINGTIHIWKYHENTRDYPGWNFAADEHAIIDLIDLLKIMEKSEWPVSKLIETVKPTFNQLKVPNNKNGFAKYEAREKLIFIFERNGPNEYWSIISNSESLEIIFGLDKLYELKETLAKPNINNCEYRVYDYENEDILFLWPFKL